MLRQVLTVLFSKCLFKTEKLLWVGILPIVFAQFMHQVSEGIQSLFVQLLLDLIQSRVGILLNFQFEG